MEIFLLSLLMTKHFVADYMLQTKEMIAEKKHYGYAGGIVHACCHALGTYIILTFFLSPIGAIILAILDGVAHYHIDWVKSNVWDNYNFNKSDYMFWLVHGLDQFLHFLTYVLIVLIGV